MVSATEEISITFIGVIHKGNIKINNYVTINVLPLQLKNVSNIEENTMTSNSVMRKNKHRIKTRAKSGNRKFLKKTNRRKSFSIAGI